MLIEKMPTSYCWIGLSEQTFHQARYRLEPVIRIWISEFGMDPVLELETSFRGPNVGFELRDMRRYLYKWF